jgi:hypothetical protein
MDGQLPIRRVDPVPVLLLLYGAASLLHFAHNAVFLDAYPNLPTWISSGGVWLSWLGVASLGVLAYVSLRLGHTLVGLTLAAIYASLGFDGLVHYRLAPIAAHTLAMNLTIWFEVAMAAVLMAAVAVRLFSHLQQRRLPAG